MSDPATTARSARESLSRGLNALQTDARLPPALLELAAPIAQAMGALHQIERSNGAQLVPHAHVALECVRKALASLQAVPPSYESVVAAMESVASSLSQIHALSKIADASAQQPPVAPVPVQPVAMVAAPPAPITATAPLPGQSTAYGAAPPPHAPYQAPPAPVAAASPPPQRVPDRPPMGAPPPYLQGGSAPHFPSGGQVVRDPFAAPAPPVAPQSPPFGGPAAPPAAAMSAGAPGAPQGAGALVNADLGAQSATNFYKGLSGNDIIDHGGLFVSTYMIPKIGTPVRLRVSLPGGYEFEANAVVRWRREQSDGSDAPPGFGAQFTQITMEARQLVYRYVRNREPLFHDDL